MLRLVVFRLILVAIPFLIWFTWRRWSLARGREIRPWPWGWLIAAAALLVGASIVITAVVSPTNVGRKYIPAETLPSGGVRPGRYE